MGTNGSIRRHDHVEMPPASSQESVDERGRGVAARLHPEGKQAQGQAGQREAAEEEHVQATGRAQAEKRDAARAPFLRPRSDGRRACRASRRERGSPPARQHGRRRRRGSATARTRPGHPPVDEPHGALPPGATGRPCRAPRGALELPVHRPYLLGIPGGRTAWRPGIRAGSESEPGDADRAGPSRRGATGMTRPPRSCPRRAPQMVGTPSRCSVPPDDGRNVPLRVGGRNRFAFREPRSRGIQPIDRDEPIRHCHRNRGDNARWPRSVR